MSDVLRIGRTRDQFLAMVEEALQERGTELARARQDSVRGGTWDARAEWVSGLIEEALREKRSADILSASAAGAQLPDKK
jgi:hypothetical protein